MSKHRILVIIGSTRDGRYGDKPAHWIAARIGEHPELESELLDLRDYPMPFFDQKLAPAGAKPGDYGHDVANRFAGKLATADGFVLTVAEYNHGYTAVLKNAMDWTYHEWARKPVAYVGYGNAGGARAVEQLRQVAVELEMMSIRRGVHLPYEVVKATRGDTAPAPREKFAPADKAADGMLEHLAWWTRALAAARSSRDA